MQIRRAGTAEFDAVRACYYAVMDEMKDAECKPGWKRDVYPCRNFCGRRWIGALSASAMIVSCEYNESYDSAPWAVDTADEEILVIYALGVRPSFASRGIAQAMTPCTIWLGRE